MIGLDDVVGCEALLHRADTIIGWSGGLYGFRDGWVTRGSVTAGGLIRMGMERGTCDDAELRIQFCTAQMPAGLENAPAPFEASFSQVEYRKDAFGRVH